MVKDRWRSAGQKRHILALNCHFHRAQRGNSGDLSNRILLDDTLYRRSLPLSHFQTCSYNARFPLRRQSSGEDDPKQSAGDDMPKQKTHKGTKKRFRLTATGKVKHRAAGTSHLASRMSKKRRRNLRGTKILSATVVHQITRALAGYSL